MRELCQIAVLLASVTVIGCASDNSVRLTGKEEAIDIRLDGRYVTTYIYGDNLAKPILWPIKTLSGIVLTRSYPFEQIEGESTDHPHHTGLFFTYDDVNGEGFWNNPKPPPRIKQVGDVQMDHESGKGAIQAVLDWTARDGTVLLRENRTMTFVPDDDQYTIDFTMELTAQDKQVKFGDTKEGMFAIRVADWMREDTGTGRYLSSNGETTEANIWGKRAEWVRLEAEKDGRPCGIAIFNHPDSVNYPTYWHARAYGLFSANPLGQGMFQQQRGVANPQPFALTLDPGQTALFKFRVLIYDGRRTPEQLQTEFAKYKAH